MEFLAEINPGYYLMASVVVLLAIVTALYKFGVWKGKIDESVSSLKDLVTEIRTDIKEIIRRLPSGTLKEGSPLELSDRGKRISDDLEAKDWAKRTSKELIDQVIDKEDFEVQEFSESYLWNEFNPTDAQDKKIRKCIYQDHRKTSSFRARI